MQVASQVHLKTPQHKRLRSAHSSHKNSVQPKSSHSHINSLGNLNSVHFQYNIASHHSLAVANNRGDDLPHTARSSQKIKNRVRPASGIAEKRINLQNRRASMPNSMAVSARYSRPVATTKLGSSEVAKRKNGMDTSYDFLASEKWLLPTEAASDFSEPTPCDLKVYFNGETPAEQQRLQKVIEHHKAVNKDFLLGKRRVLESQLEKMKNTLTDSQSKIDFLLSMAKAKHQKGYDEDGKWASINFQNVSMNHIVGDINKVIDQQGDVMGKFKEEIRKYTIGRIMTETQGAWSTVMLNDGDTANDNDGKLLKHYIKKQCQFRREGENITVKDGPGPSLRIAKEQQTTVMALKELSKLQKSHSDLQAYTQNLQSENNQANAELKYLKVQMSNTKHELDTQKQVLKATKSTVESLRLQYSIRESEIKGEMTRRLKDQENMHIRQEEANKAEILDREQKIKDKLKKKISRLEYQLSALCSKSWVPHTESEASDVDAETPKKPEVETSFRHQQPSAQMLFRQSIPRSSQTTNAHLEANFSVDQNSARKGQFVEFAEDHNEAQKEPTSVYPFFYARSYKPSENDSKDVSPFKQMEFVEATAIQRKRSSIGNDSYLQGKEVSLEQHVVNQHRLNDNSEDKSNMSRAPSNDKIKRPLIML